MRFYYFEMVGTAVFAASQRASGRHHGVITGIGGGLIRDVLAGRPTLLMSREIYATPILLGCIAFVLLRGATPPFPYAALVGTTIIFSVRALAIYRHLEMPAWLTHRNSEH